MLPYRWTLRVRPDNLSRMYLQTRPGCKFADYYPDKALCIRLYTTCYVVPSADPFDPNDHLDSDDPSDADKSTPENL